MEYALVLILSGGFFDTGLRYPTYTECLDNQVAELKNQLEVGRTYVKTLAEMEMQTKALDDWDNTVRGAQRWEKVLDEKALETYKKGHCVQVGK